MISEKDRTALLEAANRANVDVIRSHGWEGSIKAADFLGIDERYLLLAEPGQIASLLFVFSATRQALVDLLALYESDEGCRTLPEYRKARTALELSK